MTRSRTRFRLGARVGDLAHKVTWLELFFDLVFVAAVAQVAEPLREHYDLAGILRFAVLFGLIWLAWSGHTTFATRFDAEDLLTRIVTLVQMFVVAAMAANAGDSLDSHASAGFVAAYAVLRLVLVAQYARVRHLAEARDFSAYAIAGHGAAAAVWLASSMAPVPVRFWMWAAALAIDVSTPWMTLSHSLKVPPDSRHLPERFGLFTLILLGESIVSVMHGMESHETWTPAAATSAFAGMALVFVVWWWYFEGAAAAAERPVRTRRDTIRFHLWSLFHVPLYLAVVVTGVGIQRIVTAAARTAIPAMDAAILTGAAVLLMIAMVAVAETSARRDRRAWTELAPAVAVAAATALVGLIGRPASPVVLAVGVAVACAFQLAIALRSAPAGPAHEAGG
jgi:low temperature requirement protein LtrA